MAFYNAPAISLLPNFLPEEKMSYGNSILNAIGGLANIVGLLLSAFLYVINHQLAFWVMAIIMIICLFILIIFVREKKEGQSSLPKERNGLLFTIKKSFKRKIFSSSFCYLLSSFIMPPIKLPRLFSVVMQRSFCIFRRKNQLLFLVFS
ncbi:MAG: MFS transporter [Candidatus Heimdallarchaeota archaeon]